MENRDFQHAIHLGKKIHQSSNSKVFLEQCLKQKLFPNFTIIPTKTIQATNLSPNQVHQLKVQRLKKKIETEQNRYEYNSTKFNNLMSNFQNNVSKKVYVTTKLNLQNCIKSAEYQNDLKRENNLKKLKGNNINQYAEITIYNETEVIIPENVKNALKYGAELPVGGTPNKVRILTVLEQMYRKWSSYAQDQKIDPYQIIEVRANLLLMFGQLSKCYTTDKKSKILKNFLNDNPDILLIPIDKSKNMIFLKYTDYITKLDIVFSDPQKFEKLTQNPLELDIKSFRALTNTVMDCISP